MRVLSVEPLGRCCYRVTTESERYGRVTQNVLMLPESVLRSFHGEVTTMFELIGKLDAAIAVVRTKGPELADKVGDLLIDLGTNVKGLGQTLRFGAEAGEDARLDGELVRVEAECHELRAVQGGVGAIEGNPAVGFDPATALMVIDLVLKVVRAIRDRRKAA